MSRQVTNSRVKGLAACASPLALAAALLCAPHTALAQVENTGPTPESKQALGQRSDQSSVEEVVITARKREERLRDVPTAGTAMGADLIREVGGVPNAQSLLTNVPGVNFANTSNPVTSEVSIRGSGTSRATTAESGVGLFRDGAYIGGGTVLGRTFTDLDLFDPERIEVLRGVQGGLNGRNAEGGSVNVITARPTFSYGGYLFGTWGSQERYELQGAVNIPISDHWAARISIDEMRQDKGFYYLPLLHQYADQQYKDFYRGQLAYRNDIFKANFLVEHGAEQLPGLVYQVFGVPNANYPNGYAQDRFNMPWNSPSEAKMRLTNYELTTSTDLGAAELASVTMYRERSGQNAYDRDASSPQFSEQVIAAGLVNPAYIATLRASDTGLGGNQTDRAKIFYNDIHLTGAKTNGFSWVAGWDYNLLRDRPRSVLGRTPTTANPSPGTIDVGKQRFVSIAGYGSLSYDVTEKFNVAADLRVTRNREDFTSQRLDLRTGASAAAFNIAGNFTDTNVSYTVTANYKFSRNQMVYGKVGTAFRPGGFNTSLGDSRQPIPVPTSYAAETLTAYEIGYKGNILPNLYVTAAYYDNEFDNLIIQGDNGCFVGSTVCPVQATSFAFNAGSASLHGFEAEATYRMEIFDGPLRLTGGFSKQGGKVDGPVNIGGVAYRGIRQPQQPDWTTTFNINYRHSLGGEATGFFNLKGSGRKGGVQEVAQTPKLDNYTLVDGRIGVEYHQYELAAYAENLFDETYYVFAAYNPGATNVIRYNFPRKYGVTLRYTF